ncbi:FAD-dependent oxidoreductase [Sulfurimonas paralvinellae]|uniref:FAD-dependent oxidoreductase n=1 Tax=Sulfurimonas paralvinellae TaxID=317658 RepID=A0A7M1B7W4_9BACT|nr:FAD-dependent oxidoreductase [Sulfurimonas paralvinellae]QOP44812.1 FAD-dependent oxidoreductase [Sulfurimonas paralvinellae]
MKTDVLIIGAGGAGLTAAIAAKKAGVDVVVLTKEYPTRSQTCMAQGGINAALGNVAADSIEDHIQNTLKSAHGLASEEAVRYMCSEAPATIAWLDSIGVCFSRTADAKITQRKLGGASAPRACYAQDYTGLKILHTLYEEALKHDVEMKNEKLLLEILTDENGVACGAVVMDIRSGSKESYFAKSVILATGGYSRIYDKNSTNSVKSTGDGIAVAARAGAKLLDMEFVQFHPTGLKNSSILISESARGEGGYLLNSKGERFTNELAPRDEVSRAIYAEMNKGEDIFLDIRHLGEAFIDEGLPQERKLAKLYENVDPVYDLIPIKPVAHYTMGGIEVDNNSQSSIEGLYACGECSNHRVHGANRLGGNSLLEIVVFGREAGENAAKRAQEIASHATASAKDDFLAQEFTQELDFYTLREELGNLLYAKVGIVRRESELQEALGFVKECQQNLTKMGTQESSLRYNTNLIEFLEFRNMLDASEAVITGALARKESVGAHFMAKE